VPGDTDGLLDIIDRALQLALQAIKITIDFTADPGPVGLPQPDQLPPTGTPTQTDQDQGDCLSGGGQPAGVHNYWDLDARARPTGADTCLTVNNVLPGANKVPGFKADDLFRQPGYQAGHLIGAQFGGSGQDPRNLVPLSQKTNVAAMYHDFEKCVADELNTHPSESIFYEAVPIYTGSDQVPFGVVLIAHGNQGYNREKFLVNDRRYDRQGVPTCA
jgi:DNA-entry nuclease